jgi:hypothetical protein
VVVVKISAEQMTRNAADRFLGFTRQGLIVGNWSALPQTQAVRMAERNPRRVLAKEVSKGIPESVARRHQSSKNVVMALMS